MKSIPCLLAFIAVSLFAATAFGGPAIGGIPGTPGTPPPGTQPPGTDGGVIDPTTGLPNPQYKTPPMTAGQLENVQIAVHNPGPNILPNWAGVIASVHIADASEVDVTKITLPDGTAFDNPFGPASQNSQSVTRMFTVLHPGWTKSGIPLQPSEIQPVLDIELQAKNTTIVNGNSDVDVTVNLYDIYHVPGARVTIPGGGQASTPVQVFNPGSQQWTWPASGLAFVRSSINSSQDLHITHRADSALTQGGDPVPDPLEDTIIEPSMYYLRGPANQDTGKWHHIEQSIVWHAMASVTTIHRSVGGPGGTVVTLPGSFLYAVRSTSAMIGIEHVPEPAAPILLASGLVCTVFGLRSRRRRRQGC